MRKVYKSLSESDDDEFGWNMELVNSNSGGIVYYSPRFTEKHFQVHITKLW